MSQDDIKAIISRMEELQERNKDLQDDLNAAISRVRELQERNKDLQDDLIETLRILEKLNSTRSNTDSTEAPADYKSTTSPTESTQRKAEVVGYGAVRDPDGNVRTFTGGSLKEVI